ncbi:CBN-NASP-1 protein [Caenorhabditis brenneri]|uniref:CBN-NASP-1 protein n=1 Tax=Caenorhabditis brenneri TaxID=135651 RepID=G0MVF2_CAEBE|nr:CBN-NASP-1 protein [Caenorhabditis brenneri]
MNTENIIDAVGDSPENSVVNKEQKDVVSQSSEEEKKERLSELLTAGRRAIRVNNIEEASEILSQATELSTEIYGESHENTFDAYYFYGMATLELAKVETQLLKNDKDKELDREEEEDTCADEKATESKENGDESDEEEGEESSEEDDDNMRLAWELLETCRCIAIVKIEQLQAERNGVKLIEEWNLKLADVLVLLGEHGVSDGKYDQAKEDLEKALEIQKNVLPEGSRQISQTYILMANACSNAMNFEEAVALYQKTKESLLHRQRDLKQQLEIVDDKEKKAEIENDLKDLEEMIPSVDNMIADSTSSAEQVDETRKAIKAQFAGFTSILSQLPQESSSNNEEANDISNMVL